MPQMAPLNWMFLYYIFIILFVIVMSLNFYNYFMKSESNYNIIQDREESKLNNELSKIWKW